MNYWHMNHRRQHFALEIAEEKRLTETIDGKRSRRSRYAPGLSWAIPQMYMRANWRT